MNTDLFPGKCEFCNKKAVKHIVQSLCKEHLAEYQQLWDLWDGHGATPSERMRQKYKK